MTQPRMLRQTPGKSSLVVAVNGLGGLEYLWDDLRAALPAHLSLLVLDLLGHGDRPPAPDYHYDALVADVAERTAGRPPFPLIGWSVGGAVAWLFAARHPERVTHLVLLDPAAPHQSPFRYGSVPDPIHAYTYASIEKAIEAVRGIYPSVTAEDIPRIYRRNQAGRWEPRYDPAILPALVEDARDHGEEMFFELERVRVPILLLRAERSFLRQEQFAELASVIPGVRVETVAGTGHFMVRERPEAVAELIAAFL